MSDRVVGAPAPSSKEVKEVKEGDEKETTDEPAETSTEKKEKEKENKVTWTEVRLLEFPVLGHSRNNYRSRLKTDKGNMYCIEIRSEVKG